VKHLLYVAVVLAAACSGNVAPISSVECMSDVQCESKCMMGQVGLCGMDGTCSCVDDIPLGAIGEWMSMAVGPTGTAYVAAYNVGHGDLMFAELAQSGRIPDANWVFVDGLPTGPSPFPQSHVRNGQRDPGPDVGYYTSIVVTATGIPMISYYDATNHALRFAALYNGGEITAWTTYALDTGDAAGHTVAGLYTSITVDSMNRPGIAYLVTKPSNVSEIRFMQAKIAQPMLATDWTQYVVETRTNPAPPAVDTTTADIPYVNGDFITSARKADGSPVLAWYDRPNGQLRAADFSTSSMKFNTPTVVDGGNGRDVGWYPSMAITSDGKFHLTYLTFLDTIHSNLLYIDQGSTSPQVVDDGYRLDNVTGSNVPEPVYHLIGDNSGLVVSNVTAVVYQDGTTADLVLATRSNGTWSHTTIAGSENPFKGSYGFWATARLDPSELVMASYAINQPNYDSWVEIFRAPLSSLH
jgi:hypothetical protein